MDKNPKFSLYNIFLLRRPAHIAAKIPPLQTKIVGDDNPTFALRRQNSTLPYTRSRVNDSPMHKYRNNIISEKIPCAPNYCHRRRCQPQTCPTFAHNRPLNYRIAPMLAAEVSSGHVSTR